MKTKEYKQVIVVRKDLNMRKGKLAAQVAHASLKSFLDDCAKIKNTTDCNSVQITTVFDLDDPFAIWLLGSFAKIVVSVDSEEELINLYNIARVNDIRVTKVIDSGKTEFNGVPTLTCIAFGPDESKKLDKITGNLPLM
jgi:PTH2 family peptidyl-tRNA hydrolase